MNANQSPKPAPQAKQITFSEAMVELLAGKSITKLEWGDKNYYGILANSRLRLHKPDGELYDWILSEGDLRGGDYIVL